jgi:hypothetical protein
MKTIQHDLKTTDSYDNNQYNIHIFQIQFEIHKATALNMWNYKFKIQTDQYKIISLIHLL